MEKLPQQRMRRRSILVRDRAIQHKTSRQSIFERRRHVKNAKSGNVSNLVNRESTQFRTYFRRFLPVSIVERFVCDFSGLAEAEVTRFDAAVAFVDISGFTKLSESLAAQYGSEGAELLNRYISGYFEELIMVIQDYGGDIIKFAGDAMLVVWKSVSLNPSAMDLPGAQMQTTEQKAFDLEQNVLRAAACNLHLMAKLNNRFVTDDIALTLHTGIGCGDIKSIFVGGANDQWDYFVAGHPIKEMALAGDVSQKGQVVLSPHAFKVIKNHVTEFKELDCGNVHVAVIREKPNVVPLRYPKITMLMEEALYTFIPPLVRKRGELGTEAEFMAEFRRAFIMFVKVEGIDYESASFLSMLQPAVEAVQKTVTSFGGMVSRLLADDKGTRFKVIFGMPEQVHEDNSARIVLTALKIQQQLRDIKVTPFIGIAYGPVFCGDAGSDIRCEYTAVGFKVNMAARLMQAAEKYKQGILCDAETYHSAVQNNIAFDMYHDRIPIKGISEPIQVYRPTGKATEYSVSSKRARREERGEESASNLRVKRRSFLTKGIQLVGRSEELAILGATVHDVKRSGQSKCTLVEADSGLGKSALLLAALRSITQQHPDVEACTSNAVSLEKATPFFVWKSIFNQVLCTEDCPNVYQELCKYIDDEFASLIPLLNPLFDLGLAENATIGKMTVDGRAQHTRKLLLHLFQKCREEKQYLIIIDDAQWMDTSSWQMAFDVCQSLEGVALWLSLRPMPKPVPVEYLSLLNMKTTVRMNLPPLRTEDAILFACLQLNIRVLPLKFQEMLLERTQGQPLFLEELLRSLLEKELIRVEGTELLVSEKLEQDGFKSLPNSIHDFVSSRIDSLEQKTLLVLKLCSVLGNEVDVDLLARVHPSDVTREELQYHLDILCEADFLSLPPNIDDDDVKSYTFCSNVYEEVAYNMMLLKQRLKFHKRVLEAVEQLHREERDKVYHILAFHALKAEEHFKALEYSEWAGRFAVVGNANEEAVRFFKTALKMMAKLSITDAMRIEAVHVQLGEALYTLGRYNLAISHFVLALDESGNSIPLSKHARSRSMRVRAWKQRIRHKLRLGQRGKQHDRASLYRAARILERLAQAALLNGDMSLAGYSAFRLLELCERIEDHGPLVIVGYSLGAYISLVLKRTALATPLAFESRAIIDSYPNLPSLDKALADMMLGMYTASQGKWNAAMVLFQNSKDVYKSFGERKKWRECTLMIGVLLHMQCKFHACQKHFARLLVYAKEDGDLFLYSSALHWKSTTQLLISGSSEQIGHDLDKAKTMLKDLRQDTIPVQVTGVLNAFHLHDVAPDDASGASFQVQENVAVVQAFVVENIESMTKCNVLLWYDVYRYIHLLQLISDVCEHHDELSIAEFDFFLQSGKRALRAFKPHCPFPYIQCFLQLYQGDFHFYQGRVSKAVMCWKDAARLATDVAIQYVVAVASYNIGRVAISETEREHHYDNARTLFSVCGVDIRDHDRFSGLMVDEDEI